MLLTDGPFAEGAEVANGFYLLRAADRDEATKIASMIPGSAVQLRRLRDGHALAALVLLHDSRRATRVDGKGALLPLDEQDRARWDRGKIARGLDRLRRAEGSTGPYLPQAVIAAVHATAASWEHTDWATICAAYDKLLRLTDSPVVRANRALAIGFRDGPEAGLAALERAAHDPRLVRSNLVLTVRADLLRRAGRYGEAAQAYQEALVLNGSEPGRAFLRRRIGECAGQD